MTPKYRLTRRAEQDVLDIWLYVSDDSISAADKLVDRFTDAYKRLASNPGMGTNQDQYRPGLQCFPVGRYIVFFRVSDEGIEVYRVLHGARQLDDLL